MFLFAGGSTATKEGVPNFDTLTGCLGHLRPRVVWWILLHPPAEQWKMITVYVPQCPFALWLGGVPYQNRLQKKGYPYSFRSTGGPSCGSTATKMVFQLVVTENAGVGVEQVQEKYPSTVVVGHKSPMQNNQSCPQGVWAPISRFFSFLHHDARACHV